MDLDLILNSFPKAVISIDTFRGKVAKEAIEAGAAMINDISAFELDKEMINTLSTYKVPYVLMHMQGKPQNMQDNPCYKNVVKDIIQFLDNKIRKLKTFGIHDIVIDPGFGFGKNKKHNLNLLNYFPLFHSLGYPICAGLSRKSLIDNIYKDKFKSNISPNQRLSGSLSLQNIAFLNGAQIIRTHDIFEVQQSFACLEEVYI